MFNQEVDPDNEIRVWFKTHIGNPIAWELEHPLDKRNASSSDNFLEYINDVKNWDIKC